MLMTSGHCGFFTLPHPMSKSKSPNPRGIGILKEIHIRFIGAAAANLYTRGEIARLLHAEYGITITEPSIRYYLDKVRRFLPQVETALKESNDDLSAKNITRIVETLPIKAKLRLAALFEAYLEEKRKIAEDPSYEIPYANKRRRLLKLAQNVDELDEKKTFVKGSRPIIKRPDGSMDFEPFELSAKDHAEQRKTLQRISEESEGGAGGDIVINIVENPPLEETETEFQKKAREKMAAVKEKKEGESNAV
jgi:hypothetical protein